MSYKWTSGSVRRGDIYAQEDTTGDATYIDWGQDTITFKPGDDATMFLEEGKVGIGTISPTYTLDVAGDIGIDSLLRHNDDSNTYLRFLNDGFDVVVGGVKSINCDPSATRINAQNADHDFVVQTSGSPGLEDAFFVEGSSGKVGIGTDTPTAVLHVSGSDAAALFSVRSDSNIDLFTVTGSGQVGIGIPDPKIALDVHDDPTSLEDDTGGGMVIKFGGGTVAKGKLYFLHTDGNWTATDSSAVATGADQLLAISLGTDAAVDGMLIRGFFDADTELDNFSAGKAAYVSETASKMDTTAPTTADAFVRIVGYCTDQSNVIYFNPGTTWIEL